MKTLATSFVLASIMLSSSMAAPAACPFDKSQNCAVIRDILNDKGTNNLNYYASTNYDHRKSGEINVYDVKYVEPYEDETKTPGQLKLGLDKINNNLYRSGEIMTRSNLTKSPYNSPVASNPWTTKEAIHGYLEVTVKMPECDASIDGSCQKHTNNVNYNKGLWPAIWLLPTVDTPWPTNGEIDIIEAYPKDAANFDTMTAALHFNGNAPSCQGGDCRGPGFRLTRLPVGDRIYAKFRTWGFEWQPDPASKTGGQIITGYLDNQKIWGPLRTDTLPADGKNALARGFNDPNGGYYLIVNLAMGGPYAGAPNPQLLKSSMYIQSIKAYSVGGDSAGACLPPINIQSMYWPDKKQLTIGWQAPSNSKPISYFQVSNWQGKTLWKGNSAKDLSFTETSLPGKSGTYTYYLSSACEGEMSAQEKYVATVSLH